MAAALAFIIAVVIVEMERGHPALDTVTLCLSILIAAVPVALPVVMQVTLALGAGEMAKQEAIVTHLTAMQEIASMDVLCSDKTGTLTTANITVFYDQIWAAPGVSKADVLEWSALASNPHTQDDPIDVAVLRSFQQTFRDGTPSDEPAAPRDAADGSPPPSGGSLPPGGVDHAAATLQRYTVSKFVGFTPDHKRTIAYAKVDGVEIKVAKGLIDKVLCTGADGGDEWECVNAASVRDEVERLDEDMSRRGYKTLGVAKAEKGKDGTYVMKFIGIVPMLDPPRADTKWVIEQIHSLGIAVKMVTGDHANIARETCKQIGLREDVLRRDVLADGAGGRTDAERALLIENADGFAQVMPKDKNLVVRALQQRGWIVGMTGDGVNDAPALQQAHIGIAVEGATDAARNASDIILTAEGLAPIATAIVESRKIFQRVRSYVLYRIAATVQIVMVLSMLIFVYDQQVGSCSPPRSRPAHACPSRARMRAPRARWCPLLRWWRATRADDCPPTPPSLPRRAVGRVVRTTG